MDAEAVVDERMVHPKRRFQKSQFGSYRNALRDRRTTTSIDLPMWSMMCVLRFDNEAGKGDHVHYGSTESSYQFVSIDELLADFSKYIQRWNNENGNL